jgi:diguanylate cyclase (GGDEF)-like protein
MEIQQKIDHYFLLFILVSQQLVAIICTIYFFHNQQVLLVVFFIAVSSTILLALAFFCIFSLFETAQWILLFTLIAGHLFLIIFSSDQVSSIWCLTAAPITGILIGHRRGVIILITIYTTALICLLAELSSTVTIKYDGIIMLRFLFSYGLMAIYSIAMEKYRFSNLRQKNSISFGQNNIKLRDILTELPHRYCVEEHLKQSYREFESGVSSFCVILADLDNCKAINDLHGRAIGDKAIKKIGHLLRTELRKDDMAGRWSSKQFILILPNISQDAAAKIAERIRLKTCQIELFSHGERVEITLSLGVCSTDNSTKLDELLSVAENCVYQAKQMGRNMVISA